MSGNPLTRLRQWLADNWQVVQVILGTGFLGTLVLLGINLRVLSEQERQTLIAERQAQVGEAQLEIQSRAAELSCIARLIEPEISEEPLEQTVNQLYADLFQQVTEYLAEHKDASYTAALQAALPITRIISSMPAPTLHIRVSNQGQALARDVRIFMEWDRVIAADLSVSPHEECVIEKGGAGHSSVRIFCERIVSQDTVEVEIPSNWGPGESTTERLVLTFGGEADKAFWEELLTDIIWAMKEDGIVVPTWTVDSPETEQLIATHSASLLRVAELRFYREPSITTYSVTVTYLEGKVDCTR